jgi:beta-glucanase (GH16 family)
MLAALIHAVAGPLAHSAGAGPGRLGILERLKRSRLLCAGSLAACAVAACAVAISSCSLGSETTPCGPEISKSSGGNWACTFADDFSGSTLDPAKWQPMTTATTGFTQASHECYADDPANIDVADGLLTLTATKLPSPATCGTFTSPYQTGMVFTKDRFAQAYGRFEIRAKLPEGAGLQPALWMYPQHTAYGDRSGEIDIAESFGAPDYVSPHIHVHDAAGGDHPQGGDCHVADASGAFHTYTVEWEPKEIRFLYDGVQCTFMRNWDTGPPLVAPQPFDKPFFMLLQMGLGYGPNAPSAATKFPSSLEIDYVRAWS